MRNPPRWRTRSLVPLCLLLLTTGCARSAPPAVVTIRWIAGHAAPAFDPDGPPDALRAALERLLTRGLVERDSVGAVRLVAAESVGVSADERTWTLRLRAGLRFSDGSPVRSADYRAALLAGLGRTDHATRDWLLQGLAGMDRVRAGRPLPELGVETPDDRTLVLRLARPDPKLLEKLASPGVGMAWKRRDAPAWGSAVGIGPYRVDAEEPGRGLRLVRAHGRGPVRAAVDTLVVRFVASAPRVLTLLRRGAADLVWPLPPELTGRALPPGNSLRRMPARPPRRLLLVLRADVPPTTRLAARHALSHGLNREEILDALGARAGPADEWLEGGPAFSFPRLDAAARREWLARGRLGGSFHVALVFDADGPGADVARVLQGQWAEQGLDAELRPLRGADALAAPLESVAGQAQLVVAQAPAPGAAAELATLVMPLRGPAVGSFRTGWRTREFDPWLLNPAAAEALDPAAAQARLVEERIVLPLANLPWIWVERTGRPGPPRFVPDTGPEFALP